MVRSTLFVLLAFLIVATASLGSGPPLLGLSQSRCERITIPMCMEMPYNMTKMPNIMGHYSQSEAAIQAHEYIPLVDIGCSSYVRFFICSVYAPLCSPVVHDTIPACRFVCERVRDACTPVLKTVNFTWNFDCNRLPPRDGVGGVCMELPELLPPKTTPHRGAARPVLDPWIPKEPPSPSGGGGECGHRRIWVMTDRRAGMCVPKCGEDFLFSKEDKYLAQVWLFVWAALCFSSTLLTLITFLLKPSRYKYPERPIIWLSLCLFFHSLAFLIRGLASHQNLSCEGLTKDESHLAVRGLSSSGCTLTFILQYYFSFSSSLWWLILTLTWFLAAGRTWSSEALQAYASYFHGIAWGLPGAAAIIALALKQVDGSELTGTCSVGNLRPSAQMAFVIVPLSLSLTSGVIFLSRGFVALFRIRRVIQTEVIGPQQTENDIQSSSTFPCHRLVNSLNSLEKFMIRIGVFSLLYIIPAACVIGSHVYQYSHYNEWVQRASSVCPGHRGHSGGTSLLVSEEAVTRHSRSCKLKRSIPLVWVFMLQLCMSLAVGITSGIWIWSAKTLQVWRQFGMKLFRMQRSHGHKKKGLTQAELTRMAPATRGPAGVPLISTGPTLERHKDGFELQGRNQAGIVPGRHSAPPRAWDFFHSSQATARALFSLQRQETQRLNPVRLSQL